jgi:transposase
MERHRLTDAQWERIALVIPGKPGDPGRHGEDNRLFVESVLWLGRTGAPWRDLRRNLATGTRLSDAFGAGPRTGYGRAFLRR